MFILLRDQFLRPFSLTSPHATHKQNSRKAQLLYLYKKVNKYGATHSNITKFRHSFFCNHIAHVIIIIKSEVSTFPIVIIFFHGCVPEMFVTLYTTVSTFLENREFVFIIIVQFMMSANSRIRYDLQIVFVCLYITSSHYHHCANLSEDIELIKFLSDLFCRVWVRWGIFSQLSIIQYVWLCVCSLPVSLVMIERIYILCLIIII